MLQFAPFQSLVQPEFWHRLTDIKIDVLRLSDEALSITGTYTTGRSVKDRETGQNIALGTTISVGADSFQQQEGQSNPATAPSTSHGSSSLAPVIATGTFRNFNTIEEFKAVNKHELFDVQADRIWKSIVDTRSTEQLNSFITITFADLKKYKYYYWFAFPAFVAKPAWQVTGGDLGWAQAVDKFNADQVRVWLC